MLLYQIELCRNAVCFTVLKRRSIFDTIFSLIFFYYIEIFIVNNTKYINIV